MYICKQNAGSEAEWLHVQVRLLCITDEVLPHAQATAASMQEAGIRAEVESGALLHAAQLATAPTSAMSAVSRMLLAQIERLLSGC